MTKIKGWDKFQHFKDRRPPWVKLYRDLLDDMEWHRLTGDAAKTLVMLWLIASEADGQIPADEALAFRLRVPLADLVSHMKQLDHWFETPRYQVDIKPSQNNSVAVVPNSVAEVSVYQETETETETEKETEGEKEKTAPRKRSTTTASLKPDDVGQQTWDDWVAHRKAKRATVTATVLKSARKESEKAGMALEAFFEVWCARGSQGLEAAWLTASERGQGAIRNQVSFRQADQIAEKRAQDLMTGRPAGDVIDMENPTGRIENGPAN